MLSSACSTSISWTVRGTIKDLDAFKVIKAKLIESTEKEEGTLQYEWYITPNQTEFMVVERYRDLTAAEIHNASFGDKFAGEFLAACEINGISYAGELSESLETAFKQMGATFYQVDGGLNRIL